MEIIIASFITTEKIQSFLLILHEYNGSLIILITVSKGPFTWKEDDPSAGIILALGSSERGMFSAFSLHVKGCIRPQC